MDLGWGRGGRGRGVLGEEIVWGGCVWGKRMGELGKGVGLGEGAEEG